MVEPRAVGPRAEVAEGWGEVRLVLIDVHGAQIVARDSSGPIARGRRHIWRDQPLRVQPGLSRLLNSVAIAHVGALKILYYQRVRRGNHA